MSSGLITIPKHYVSDWSQGHGAHWAEISPYFSDNTYWYTPYPPVGMFVNGEWVARYTRASMYGKIQTMPRFVLSAKEGFDVEVPITLNICPNTGVPNPYFSVALYNGEASYFGLYFTVRDDGQGIVYVHNCGYRGFETNIQGLYIYVTDVGWWATGDKIYAKIVCDPVAGQTRLYARNETKDPGGEYTLMWVRYHEVMLETDPRLGVSGPDLVSEGVGGLTGGTGSADFRWLEPCSLWLSGSSFHDGAMKPPWHIDLHPITINQYGDGEILGGAGSFYPWSRYWNPNPSGFNLWPQEFDPYVMKETQEAALQPEGLAPYILDEYESYFAHFLSSSFVGMLSPVIARNGMAWATLRLYGRETPYEGSPYQSGTVKIEILNSATQQPIVVGGVSEWHPDGGAFVPLEVDLSNITAPEIQLRFAMYSNEGIDIAHNGGWVYQAVTPILYGFVITGTIPPPFAPPAGRYQEAQTVTLTDPAGGLIIYTTDGSDPRHYIPVDEFTGKASFDENTGELVLTDEPYAP